MDTTTYFRFILALILVLGLIMGMAWVMRRLGVGGGARGLLTRKKRLRNIETTLLDSRHKVVLLRRDDVEHLILIGPNTSQVIERGIPSAALDAATPEESAAPLSFRNLLSKDPQP